MNNNLESFDNKALQVQSSLLSPEEQIHPHKVLDIFFDFATVAEAKACLDALLLAAFRAQDGEELNYLYLYRHLSRLVEACWLLHRPVVPETS